MVLFLTTILWISATKYDKIYYGTYVSDINVGGLTVEEAEAKINKELKNRNPVITLLIEENKLQINSLEFCKYNSLKTAQNAYSKGRNNCFLKFATFITPFSTKDVNIVTSINKNKLKQLLNNFKAKTDIEALKTTYEIQDEILKIHTGHSGKISNADKMFKDVTDSIVRLKTSTVHITPKHIKYDKVDIEKIQKEICKKARNASIDYESDKVINAEIGIDFDIEQAKKLLSKEKENSTYKIKLIITQPKVTLETLKDVVFKETIASYSTKFDKSNTNRSTNIKLASSKINGVILLSGETFSYNQTVGNRTLSAGFKSAPVYEGNKVTDGIGGGICQVSSTLYNTVLYSGLEIVERTNHSLPVSYVPLGQDATVAWNAVDFKFKNTFDFPIKIEASANDGVCTVTFKGFKKNDYTIKIINSTNSINYFKTSYTNDLTLNPGQTKILQKGSNGSKITSKRLFIVDGTTIKSEALPSSNYMATDELIAINPLVQNNQH